MRNVARSLYNTITAKPDNDSPITRRSQRFVIDGETVLEYKAIPIFGFSDLSSKPECRHKLTLTVTLPVLRPLPLLILTLT